MSFQERILPQMEETLDIVRASYEGGDVSMLEVLDAYRSLAESELAYLTEAYQARVAHHDLMYLVGEGD